MTTTNTGLRILAQGGATHRRKNGQLHTSVAEARLRLYWRSLPTTPCLSAPSAEAREAFEEGFRREDARLAELF